MIAAFLIGFAAAAATIVVVAIALMCGKWVKDHIKERKKHRVPTKDDGSSIVVDTEIALDEYLKNKADNAEEVSMDDLERISEEIPFIIADVDENGEISNYEGFKPKEVDANFKARMKQQRGIILVEA